MFHPGLRFRIERMMKRAALFLALLHGAASAQSVLAPEWMKQDAASLSKEFPSLKFDFYKNPGDAAGKAAAAEAFIGTPDEAVMKAGEKLRWVHVYSAGIEKYTHLPRFKEGKVTVTNLKIYQGPEIADHAFALLLHLTRNMAEYQKAQEDGSWPKSGPTAMPLTELRGRTMLVIGFGGIGTQVAERARAFGMKVMAIDEKDIPLTQTLEYCGRPDELNELLPKADVVVNCVPHTPASEHMIAAPQFAAMKDGAYFINVSRGKVVDTVALVKALQDKKLAGAGLDVVDPEPLPADSPLRKMKNVIITPHIAGVSGDRPGRQNELIRDNLGRFARGLPLKNATDPGRGY